jgi:hypothetical protein
MQAIPGDYTNATGDHVDFDGTFDLRWTPQGGEQGFEIEQSTDNQNWGLLADVGAGATSYSLSNQASGTYYFRIRGLAAGAIGQYVTAPSTASSIVVDQRSKVDITSLVSRCVSNVSLNANVFQLDLALTNNSAQNYVPLVDLNVIGYNSGSGTIRAINADNGKSGTSPANPALFGYSQKIGSDQIFSANEVTSARTLRFQDNAQELFTFDAVVTAYVSAGGSSSSSSSSSTSSSASPPSSGSPSTAGILKQINAVMRFTANPLTKTVTVQLVSLK